MEIEVGGQIQGISLGSFLQIVYMDKTSCTLKIYSNDEVGYLYLKDGALVAAEAGELKNVEAAYEILSWNKTVIIIDNAPIPDQKIDEPLMSILMEGLRRKDEKNAQLEISGQARTELDIQFDPETYVSKDDEIASQFVAEAPAAPTEEVSFETPVVEQPSEPAAEKQLPLEEDETTAESPDTTQIPETEEAETDDQVSFEGEDEPLPPRSFKKLLIKLLASVVVLSIAALGGLRAYKFYSAKQEYNRILDQVKTQKKLKTKKTLLSTYLNAQNDDSRYIPDIIGKMNEIDLLIEIEEKVKALPINDQYEKKASNIYNDFLSEKSNSFFKGYVQGKITEIPLAVEGFEFKKLGAATGLNRDERMAKYQGFLKRFPKTKHRQAVENMIAAVGDEFYTELKREISKCNAAGNWDKCITLSDRFIKEFSHDNRVVDLLDVRNEMQDRADFTDLKFRATAMDFNDAKKMYIAYLQKNSESSVKKEIRAEITLLNRKIDFQSKWEEAYAYCTNPDVELHHRIKELKDFMDRDYSGLFRTKAENLMKELKDEERMGKAKALQLKKAREEKARLAKIQAEKDRIAKEKEMARLAKIKQKQKEELLVKESKRLNNLFDQTGGRFVGSSDRTVKDTRTGLVWCLFDSKTTEDQCMTYKQAAEYVKTINTGGYKDWRLPDTSELALIYNSKPYYPSSGANWYWTSETRSGAWTHNEKAAIFYPDKKDEFNKVFLNHNECGYVHAVRP